MCIRDSNIGVMNRPTISCSSYSYSCHVDVVVVVLVLCSIGVQRFDFFNYENKSSVFKSNQRCSTGIGQIHRHSVRSSPKILFQSIPALYIDRKWENPDSKWIQPAISAITVDVQNEKNTERGNYTYSASQTLRFIWRFNRWFSMEYFIFQSFTNLSLAIGIA